MALVGKPPSAESLAWVTKFIAEHPPEQEPGTALVWIKPAPPTNG